MKYGQLLNRARDENVLNSVLLELTYRCNLDCSFCYNDLSLTGRRVTQDQYLSLLDDLESMGVMSLTLSGGEPLMYPGFFELGAYAREKGFIIKVKSNGIPLNLTNAKRLRNEVDPFIVETSMHGARAESHDRLTQTPGSFERLIRNIRILKEQGLRVKVNSTLTRWNEHEVEEMFNLTDQLGVTLQFDPEVTPRDDGDMSPLEIKASEAGIRNMVRVSMKRARASMANDKIPVSLKTSSGTAPITNKKQKVCGAGSTNVIVDPFGNVYPCVQFRRKVGSIHEQTISQIWHGSEEIKTIRTLAEQAFDVAIAGGLKQFCMGLNEMHTSDPLKTHDAKLEINRVYDRISWEIQQDSQNVV